MVYWRRMQERNPVQHTHPHPTPAPVMQPGQPMQNQPNHPLMRKMNKKSNMPMVIVASVLVVFAGVATGWFLSGGVTATETGTADVSTKQQNEVQQSANEAGVSDTKDFPDTAEGKLVKGGIDGEGQYHLERTGGVSQNVYLTSTVIDLASFEGKSVKVWGQSLSGKKAGWLMDVGKVKVVE